LEPPDVDPMLWRPSIETFIWVQYCKTSIETTPDIGHILWNTSIGTTPVVGPMKPLFWDHPWCQSYTVRPSTETTPDMCPKYIYILWNLSIGTTPDVDHILWSPSIETFILIQYSETSIVTTLDVSPIPWNPLLRPPLICVLYCETSLLGPPWCGSYTVKPLYWDLNMDPIQWNPSIETTSDMGPIIIYMLMYCKHMSFKPVMLMQVLQCTPLRGLHDVGPTSHHTWVAQTCT
jgi:hypothetical protein